MVVWGDWLGGRRGRWRRTTSPVMGGNALKKQRFSSIYNRNIFNQKSNKPTLSRLLPPSPSSYLPLYLRCSRCIKPSSPRLRLEDSLLILLPLSFSWTSSKSRRDFQRRSRTRNSFSSPSSTPLFPPLFGDFSLHLECDGDLDLLRPLLSPFHDQPHPPHQESSRNPHYPVSVVVHIKHTNKATTP